MSSLITPDSPSFELDFQKRFNRSPVCFFDPSLPASETASKVESAARVIPDTYLLHSSAAPNFLYTIGDASNIIRNTHKICYNINGNSSPFSTNPLASASSSLSIFTGGFAISNSYLGYQKANKVDDLGGKIGSRGTMIRGILEIFGGIISTPAWILSFLASSKGMNAIVPLMHILFIIGSVLFVGVYGLLILPAAISLKSTIPMRRAFNKVFTQNYPSEKEKYHAAIEYLMNSLKLNNEEKKNLLNNLPKNVGPEESFKNLTPSDLEWIEFIASSEEQVPLLKTAYANALQKKELIMHRIVNNQTVELIKAEITKPQHKQITHLLQLEGEHAEALDQAKSIVSKFLKNSRSNCILQTALIITCTIGIISLIAGIFVTGGILSIVVTAGFIITACGMLGIDGYSLFLDYKNQPSSLENRAMIIGMTLLLVGAVATLLFTGGIILFISIGTLLLLWTALSTYSHYKWSSQITNNPILIN